MKDKQHTLRALLDRPWHQKGFVFFLLLPLLFPISFFVALINLYRRALLSLSTKACKTRKARKACKRPFWLFYPFKFFSHEWNHPDSKLIKKVMVIGNLTIGGSGKSPVVRKLAYDLLKKGYAVAVLARGYKSSKVSQTLIKRSRKGESDFSEMGDELLEHYEWMKMALPENEDFFILQNSNKAKGYFDFLEFLKANPLKKEVYLLLEDGLQSFGFLRREVEWGVMDIHLFGHSPSFCYPVGPFREGFGSWHLRTLIHGLPYRLWSRFPSSTPSHEAKVEVAKILNAYKLPISSKDYVVKSHLTFSLWDQSALTLKPISKEEASTLFALPVTFLSGIAYPERFIKDVTLEFTSFDYKAIHLEDHGDLPPSFFDRFEEGEKHLFILTLKDFCRFKKKNEFQDLLKKTSHTFLICLLDISLEGLVTPVVPQGFMMEGPHE
jgi:tetraacyldisaccharide 4'-kinase